jgi:hypothetical protein
LLDCWVAGLPGSQLPDYRFPSPKTPSNPATQPSSNQYSPTFLLISPTYPQGQTYLLLRGGCRSYRFDKKYENGKSV